MVQLGSRLEDNLCNNRSCDPQDAKHGKYGETCTPWRAKSITALVCQPYGHTKYIQLAELLAKEFAVAAAIVTVHHLAFVHFAGSLETHSFHFPLLLFFHKVKSGLELCLGVFESLLGQTKIDYKDWMVEFELQDNCSIC